VLLFLHGYSGSPYDFADVPQLLAKKLGMPARVPVLAGHDKGVWKLRRTSLRQMTESVVDAMSAFPEPPVLIGNSLGAHLGLLAAAERPARAVICVSAPQKINPPWESWWIRYGSALFLHSARKRGPAPPAQRVFKRIPGNAMIRVYQARQAVGAMARRVKCPVLCLGPRDEFLIAPDAHIKLAALLPDAEVGDIPPNPLHAPFYPPVQQEVVRKILIFLQNRGVVRADLYSLGFKPRH